jgi:hypothetical protein
LKKIWFFILVLLISGCTSLPFKHSTYISFKDLKAERVILDYSSKLPDKFELLNSALFRYWCFRFPGLGVTRINTSGDTLDIVGFNHLGVMLFDLSLNNGKVVSRYIFPEFTKHGDIAPVILGDIQKLYFDRVPPSGSLIRKDKYKVIFKDQRKASTVEYVFSGEGEFLSRKNYYEGKKKIWSVFYYDYQLKDGKIYPKGIVLKNYRYGYELIVRLKEIR